MIKRFKTETTPEIGAEASKCDYIETCAMVERMKRLERTGIVGNINELLGIYWHIFKYCNNIEHPQCEHFRYEMLKTYDIMV